MVRNYIGRQLCRRQFISSRSIKALHSRYATWLNLSTVASELDADRPTGAESSPRLGGGLFRLLDDEERGLLEEQRDLTARSRRLAFRVGMPTGDFGSHSALTECASTFCVVVAGEFNAGKSTLINALLGRRLLDTGSLPTTDIITVLTHDTEDEIRHPGVLHHRVGLPLLEDLTLVDTPGTNAVLADHTSRTMRLLPSADLILFVTSADRPFTDSERQLLDSISSGYRKSVVVVVNKMDVLEDSGGAHGAAEKRRVVDFVTEHASELLGGRPMVLPVSSRQALAAKLVPSAPAESALWRRSNFAALESFLKDSLTVTTKIRSKLTSPLGVAEGLMEECLQRLNREKEDLEADVATLNLLHSQFVGWHKELQLHMEQARKEMTRPLEHEANRCNVLLQRISWMQQYQWSLLESSNNQLQQEWDSTKGTLAFQHGVEEGLLEMVREAADSIATRGRAQGQAVIEFLGKRPASRNQSLVGSVTAASRFEETRQNLERNMSAAVRRHANGMNRVAEDSAVSVSLQSGARFSAAAGASALATAAAVAAQLVDLLTGTVASTALIASAGYALSSSRRKTVKRHQELWENRSKGLEKDLEEIYAKELDRLDRRIRDVVSPYTRFVEAEQERIHNLVGECDDILAATRSLRNRINRL